MLKVLMFGWEFPPHISGGLGTACHGLTNALQGVKVKLLFVVPKLYGDEAAGHVALIDASDVAGPRKPKRKTTTVPARSLADGNGHDTTGRQALPGEKMTYITVPSALKPYYDPGESGYAVGQLEHWNYSFQRSSPPGTAVQETKLDSIMDVTVVDDCPEVFNFSGTYGPNLMLEVEKYADVAATIATKHSFDVIHAHDWMTYPAGITAKKISGKPLVIHVHSTEFDRSGERINRAVFQIERTGFSQADHIITVSNWTKQIVISRYGIPADKITVVHNGIVPKDTPLDFSFPDIGSHFVTFLGRVTHQKGPGFFVEAAEKVLQEFPDAHFIVAGAGDLLPQIIERVAQLNMSAKFHFTGFLSGNQVDHIWSLTDVYVMPSVSEPFGIAPLEAIQGGVPVILSKQSGVSEVMPHAIKIDFWDTTALAGAICSVLRYESLSHVLRQNSKKHIKNLTWDKAAREVKAVYHELTGKK